MATVPALIAEDHPAVDARPLVEFGLFDFVPLSSSNGPTSHTSGKSLFNWLGDERVYGELVRSLSHRADRTATGLAVDLDEDPALVREAFDQALREWHIALARLADKPIILAEHDAASTVLAPVHPNTTHPTPG